MARFTFNLTNRAMIDNMRLPYVYDFNTACNLALMSNDTSVIRRFFQVDVARYFKDQWLTNEVNNLFLSHYEPGQAFVYFGICPMIVQGKVNLIASNGFNCKSDDKNIEKALNRAKEKAELEKKFVEGAYWESGIGDVAYRISYDPTLSDEPIVETIKPQNLEVNWSRGRIKSFTIKEASKENPNYELCELHYKNERGFACINYRFRKDGKYIAPDSEAEIKEARQFFAKDLKLEPIELPFKDFLIVYKQNDVNSNLYDNERGVPDIQGMLSIEDGLTEAASDLLDTIRKSSVKEYVSEELIPQTIDGEPGQFDPFRKRIITTKGSSTPGDSRKLIELVQGQINYDAYLRPIQMLCSQAINKAGLAPTTLGLTGFESINSSAESQDAREKTSLRKREVCLASWEGTLKELLNKWLQVNDYIKGRTIIDYTPLINIQFNDYTNPSLENITDVLAKQVAGGLKSQQTAISELNDGWSEEQVSAEFEKIQAERSQTPTIDENINKTVNTVNSGQI